MSNLRKKVSLHQQQRKRRLLQLFEEIEDRDMREIMIDVIALESRHRSLGKTRFPLQKVEDIIDRVARLREEGTGRGDES